VATAVVFSTWATGAFYQAFVPALTIEKLGTRNALVMGLVFSAYMAPAVLGAPIGGRFRPQTAQRIGMLTFLVAMTGIVSGLALSNLPLFIVASIVGGTGQGIAVSASIRGLLHGSRPDDRAPIFGGIYLLSYAGAAIPSFISGQLSRTYSPFQLAIGYGVVALLATLVTLLFAKPPERAGVEA
jgi:MFS family permease